jgi:hypothetical protein
MNIAAMLAAVAAHKAAGGTVVLSTTSQTITALSISLALPQLECLAKLKTFFHSVGVDYVLDTVTARHVTNAETAQEFMQRVSPEGGGCTNGLLSSTCPGWVCYVEKSQPCALPYLSSVRSPQQVQGVIVKTILARALGVPSSRVFHCTLMPCFDKKLEAMRLQFAPENVPDVDMVRNAPPLIRSVCRRCFSRATGRHAVGAAVAPAGRRHRARRAAALDPGVRRPRRRRLHPRRVGRRPHPRLRRQQRRAGQARLRARRAPQVRAQGRRGFREGEELGPPRGDAGRGRPGRAARLPDVRVSQHSKLGACTRSLLFSLSSAHARSQIRAIKGQKSIPHFVEVAPPASAHPPIPQLTLLPAAGHGLSQRLHQRRRAATAPARRRPPRVCRRRVGGARSSQRAR